MVDPLAVIASDEVRLAEWFPGAVAEARGPVRLRLLTGGHSNLTYEVTDAAGRRWVLRRPPPVEGETTAHDMRREHRILLALAETDVPVPPVITLCDDRDVIGAPFYVMDLVPGTVLGDAEAAMSIPEPARRRSGLALAEVLARIHAVDPDAVGLGDLGRRTGYLARQLRRWYGQYTAVPSANLPLVHDLHDELGRRLPDTDVVAIVHGDYRLENCIVSPDGEVAAVLDWELCTLGDPGADLGLLWIYWTEAADRDAIFPQAPTVADGFPRRRDVLDRYAAAVGSGLDGLELYVAFGYWKLACISATVHDRYLSGAMGDRQPYDGLADQSERCARAAALILERGLEQA